MTTPTTVPTPEAAPTAPKSALMAEMRAYKKAPNKEAAAAATTVQGLPAVSPTERAASTPPPIVEKLPANFIGGPETTPITPSAKNSETPQTPTQAAAVSPTAPPPAKGPEAAAPAPTPSQQAAVAPVAEPFLKYGDKTFANQAEAAQFMATLERQAAEFRAYQEGMLSAQVTPAASVAPAEPEIPDGELMFSDPDAYRTRLEARIEAKIAAKFAAQEAAVNEVALHKSIWDRFYDANPRLRDFPDLVKLKVGEVSREYGANYPAEKGLIIAAERTLQYLDRVKDKMAPSTVIPPTEAVVATGGLALVPASDPAPTTSTFTDQINSVRKRRA